MITYNDITQHVKNNNKKVNVNIDTNEKFEQKHEIPLTNLPKISENDIETINKSNKKPLEKPKQVKKENIINYKQNEIINLPDSTNVYLDKNMFYTYGITDKNSILKSILFTIDSNYKLASDNQKKIILNEFICLLNADLNNSFKEHNLALYDVKKINIQKQLSNSEIDDYCGIYLSKYMKVNLIIIDPYDETYQIFDDLKKENNNIVLIKYIDNNKIFLPLLHIYGKLPDNSVIEDIFNNLKCKISLKKESNDKLKSMSNYSLIELQKLANSRNIDLYMEKDGKRKKKTKNILYSELSDLFSK